MSDIHRSASPMPQTRKWLRRHRWLLWWTNLSGSYKVGQISVKVMRIGWRLSRIHRLVGSLRFKIFNSFKPNTLFSPLRRRLTLLPSHLWYSQSNFPPQLLFSTPPFAVHSSLQLSPHPHSLLQTKLSFGVLFFRGEVWLGVIGLYPVREPLVVGL